MHLCNTHNFVFERFWKWTEKLFREQIPWLVLWRNNVSICSVHGIVRKVDKLLAQTLVRGDMFLIITIPLLRRKCFHILTEISSFSLAASEPTGRLWYSLLNCLEKNAFSYINNYFYHKDRNLSVLIPRLTSGNMKVSCYWLSYLPLSTHLTWQRKCGHSEIFYLQQIQQDWWSLQLDSSLTQSCMSLSKFARVKESHKWEHLFFFLGNYC